MIRAGIIGFGKMGMTHYAHLNQNPKVKMVAICDNSNFILAVMSKYGGIKCFKDYKQMVSECDLQCVVVATPTSSHAEIVRYCVEHGIHVFVEKPFCLNTQDGKEIVALTRQRQLVGQVGYHCRFCGVFQKVKSLLEQKVIGQVYQFVVEVYGNVVSKKAEGITWRAKRMEGGGCLYDYTSHGIDLLHYLIGAPQEVSGTVFRSINSKELEDAVSSTLLYDNGITGQLLVNWCDPSYRKMFNQITIWGTKGKVIADRQECKIYLQEANDNNHLSEGWNVMYTTDVTQPVDFYIRGEEYSAQLDHFIACIDQKVMDNASSFAKALETDILIDLLAKDAEKRKI